MAPAATGTVVSVGEALFDCLADQLGVPREEVASWTPYPGGAPANVAAGLARLGQRAVFVGALGRDALGDRFAALLAERGVDTAVGLQRVDGRPTRDVLVTRSADGDRVFAGFGAAASAAYADCFLDAARLPTEAIAGADALVTGTLGLACAGSAAALRAAVAAARAGGRAVIVVDVNWRPVFWPDAEGARAEVAGMAAEADILKVTDEEAEWLLGVPAAEALAAPGRVLAAAPGAPRGVLVSAGENGSAYAFRGADGAELAGAVPVMDVEVVDTTGAGDAYLAGFIHSMLAAGGLDALLADAGALERAVRFATACGAATCTGAGAIDPQPTAAQAEALLRKQGWA
jgi:fructokinase